VTTGDWNTKARNTQKHVPIVSDDDGEDDVAGPPRKLNFLRKRGEGQVLSPPQSDEIGPLECHAYASKQLLVGRNILVFSY